MSGFSKLNRATQDVEMNPFGDANSRANLASHAAPPAGSSFSDWQAPGATRQSRLTALPRRISTEAAGLAGSAVSWARQHPKAAATLGFAAAALVTTEAVLGSTIKKKNNTIADLEAKLSPTAITIATTLPLTTYTTTETYSACALIPVTATVPFRPATTLTGTLLSGEEETFTRPAFPAATLVDELVQCIPTATETFTITAPVGPGGVAVSGGLAGIAGDNGVGARPTAVVTGRSAVGGASMSTLTASLADPD